MWLQVLHSQPGRAAGVKRSGSPVKRAPHRFRPSLDELEERQLLSVTLGTAANYGVLGLANTKILNSNVTITGNEGVSQGGKLTNMAPSTIAGNVDEYASGQYSGPGHLGGTVNTNPTLLAQVDADALAASAQAAALPPTQTLGTVASPTTVTGNGGLNVIAVNGDIKSSLILSGNSSDVFIVNVTGSVALSGSTSLGLAGGVTADHVLYNFIGPSGTIATHVGNVLNGTLLGPTYSFNLDGAFNGEIIGGGPSITLLSQARVTEIPFNPGFAQQPASLSGTVFWDQNFNGVQDAGEPGIAGAIITLYDSNGNVVATTQTDAYGNYSFTGLAAGTYTVIETPPGSFQPELATPGTVGGNTDGSALGNTQIGQIVLNGGDNGVSYNFADVSPTIIG
jgi:hypothetical protein